MFIPLHDQNSLKHVRLQYVTLILIAINVMIWLLTATPAFLDQKMLQEAYFAYGFVPAVINGEVALPAGLDRQPIWASYFTYAFFHGDFMHVAGNMLFLWVFGDNVEDAMGHLRFFFFYMLCAAAGAVGYLLYVPDSTSPLVGASGAASGVIAAYLMLHPRVKVWLLVLGRIPLRIPALWALSAWIAFQVYSLVTDTDSQVAWIAHIAGLIAGALLVLVMKRRDVALFDRNIPPLPPMSEVPPLPDHVMETAKQSAPTTMTSDLPEKKKLPWGRQ